MCRLISAQFSENDLTVTVTVSDSVLLHAVTVMTVTNSIVLGRYGDGANDDDWVLVCIVRTVVPSR